MVFCSGWTLCKLIVATLHRQELLHLRIAGLYLILVGPPMAGEVVAATGLLLIDAPLPDLAPLCPLEVIERVPSSVSSLTAAPSPSARSVRRATGALRSTTRWPAKKVPCAPSAVGCIKVPSGAGK